jgi:hypothetical protein
MGRSELFLGLFLLGCSSAESSLPEDDSAGGSESSAAGSTDQGGSGAALGNTAGQSGKAGASGTGGPGGASGKSGGGGAHSQPDSGSIGVGGSSGTPGVWQDVTPAAINLDPTAFSNSNFGVMDVVTDPVRPMDLYAFTCYQGVWRSTDFGATFAKVSEKGSVLEKGRQWAAAIDPDMSRNAANPPTLYTPNGYGTPGLFRSTDWGVTWVLWSTPTGDPYSIDIDPYDNQHILIGFHETAGVAESTDGAKTWRNVATPGSGNSIYPFFLDTGDRVTTRTTWLMIPQNNASAQTYRTTNSGQTWNLVGSFSHPHGACQIFNAGAGVLYAPGPGVERSTDLGLTWKQVGTSWEACVTGTPSGLYSSPSVNFSPGPPVVQKAQRGSGTTWNDMTVPTSMKHGAKRMAITSDGTHQIVVAGSWMSGIWRYVEP